MTRPPDPKSTSTQGLSAGLTFAAVVALFVLGGRWLDTRCATSPLFVLLGLALGLVGGTIHMLRVLAPATLPFGKTRKTEKKEPDERQPPPP